MFAAYRGSYDVLTSFCRLVSPYFFRLSWKLHVRNDWLGKQRPPSAGTVIVYESDRTRGYDDHFVAILYLLSLTKTPKEDPGHLFWTSLASKAPTDFGQAEWFLCI